MYRIAVLLPFALCAQGVAQDNSRAAESISLAQAIESTLREHPLLRIQEQQVQINRGAVLSAQAQFDHTLQSGVSVSRTYQPLSEVERSIFNSTSATTNTSSFDFEATQQFRNGISAGPLLSVTRTTDNIAAQFGLNQSHVGYQVNIPLLRGRGREVVGVRETTSGIEVDASLLDLNQTVSDLLFNTAAAYWSAVAARRTLDVYRDAEARGQILLETVQALIQADKIPRSDVSEVQANLADRTASRIAADQQLLQARQQLAVAMGTSSENMAAGREPTDPLPTAAAGSLPENNIQAAITEALGRRADFLATKKRQAAAELLAGATKNQLKPQLDVQFSTGYSGLKDGTNPQQYFISPFVGVHGVDAIGGIRYQFPLENRSAQGALLQARSSLLQATLRSQESARNIASAVIVAEEGVRSAVLQLEKVNQSVLFFRTALDNEREKYQLGVGSLVQVLTVEDRLTGVLAVQVQAELGYALALAKLRQATGTIVAPDQAVQSVDAGIFLAPPAPRN